MDLLLLMVAAVLTLTLPATWLINHFVLIPLGVEFLRFVAFIVVIAALVQVVEMFIERYSPALYNSLGIFLPLITVNCAILGATLFGVLWNFNFVQSAVFGFSGMIDIQSLGTGG